MVSIRMDYNKVSCGVPHATARGKQLEDELHSLYLSVVAGPELSKRQHASTWVFRVILLYIRTVLYLALRGQPSLNRDRANKSSIPRTLSPRPTAGKLHAMGGKEGIHLQPWSPSSSLDSPAPLSSFT